MNEKEINEFINNPAKRRLYIKKLVNSAKKGDQDSLDILYKAYYSDAYYVSFNIVNSKENAEDIAQDTFVSAFSAIRKLKDPMNFEPWIRKIAANLSINFLKRNNRITLEPNDEIIRLAEAEDNSPGPEDTAIDSDVKITLEDIISRLPEDQRQALFLFYYESMSTREISEMYGCPESTIKSRLRYAREAMRKEVEKLEDKGFRLRCLTILPFLYVLYYAQKAEVAIIPATSFFSAPVQATAGAAIINASVVAAGAAGKVGGLALSSKIGIGAVCAAVAVGGSFGGAYVGNTMFTGSSVAVVSEETDHNNWGVAEYNSVYYDSSIGHYSINIPRIRTFTESALACACQGDGTLVMYGGIESDKADPELISYNENKFPENFSTLRSALSGRLGDYEWKIDDSEPVAVNGRFMIRYDCSTITDEDNGGTENNISYGFRAYATTLDSNGATVYWLCMNTSDEEENLSRARETADKMALSFTETDGSVPAQSVVQSGNKLELISVAPADKKEAVVNFDLPYCSNLIDYGVRSMGMQKEHIIDSVYTVDPDEYKTEQTDDSRRYVFLRDSLIAYNKYTAADKYSSTLYENDFLLDDEYFSNEFVTITDENNIRINGYDMTRVEGIFRAHYQVGEDIRTRPLYFVYYYTDLKKNGEQVVWGFLDSSFEQNLNDTVSSYAADMAESLREVE